MVDYYETPYSIRIFCREHEELRFSSGLSGKMWEEIEFTVNDVFESLTTEENANDNDVSVCITGSDKHATRMDILAFPKKLGDPVRIPTFLAQLSHSIWMTPLEHIDRQLFPKEQYGEMFMEVYKR